MRGVRYKFGHNPEQREGAVVGLGGPPTKESVSKSQQVPEQNPQHKYVLLTQVQKNRTEQGTKAWKNLNLRCNIFPSYVCVCVCFLNGNNEKDKTREQEMLCLNI